MIARSLFSSNYPSIAREHFAVNSPGCFLQVGLPQSVYDWVEKGRKESYIVNGDSHFLGGFKLIAKVMLDEFQDKERQPEDNEEDKKYHACKDGSSLPLLHLLLTFQKLRG